MRDATSPADPLATPAVVCAGRLESDPAAGRITARPFALRRATNSPSSTSWPTASPPARAGRLDLRTVYPEFGIPLFSVDANDAIAAYRVATEALHNARHLRGPCVIEALAVPQPPKGAASLLELLASYMKRHGNPPPAELD